MQEIIQVKGSIGRHNKTHTRDMYVSVGRIYFRDDVRGMSIHSIIRKVFVQNAQETIRKNKLPKKKKKKKKEKYESFLTLESCTDALKR